MCMCVCVYIYIYIERERERERNEIGSFVETWMDLESVIQNKVSQEEKNT